TMVGGGGGGAAPRARRSSACPPARAWASWRACRSARPPMAGWAAPPGSATGGRTGISSPRPKPNPKRGPNRALKRLEQRGKRPEATRPTREKKGSSGRIPLGPRLISPVAGDQRAQGLLAGRCRHPVRSAVGHARAETVMEEALQIREWAVRIELKVGGLGPRHRPTRFHDEECVTRTVGE